MHRKPRQIRKREYAYMATAAFLALFLFARLESEDVSHQVIEEAHERAIQRHPALSYPFQYIATMKTCVAVWCEPQQYAVSKGPR